MRGNRDDPFDDIFREIERMMQDMMGFEGDVGVARGDDIGADTHVDIHEYEDEIRVVADLPGVAKGAIDLQCDGRVLSIQATSGDRRYDERIRLPSRVDEQSASATYNNGILEIVLARADDSADISVE